MHTRHYHLSGRYDRPAQNIKSSLIAHLPLYAMATGTECGSTSHHAALREAIEALGGVNDWHLIHPEGPLKGECWLAFRNKIDGKPLKIIEHGSFQPAPDQTYYRPDGTRVKPGYVVWAVTEVDGTKGYHSVAHMPVHADTPTGLNNKAYRRVLTYWAWLRGWHKGSREIRRKYKISHRNTTMTADWNLRFDGWSWVRPLLRRFWPLMPVTWGWPVRKKQKLNGKLGTIGKEIIDGTLTGAKVISRPRVLDDPFDASDHRPYRETLDLWTKSRWRKKSHA